MPFCHKNQNSVPRRLTSTIKQVLYNFYTTQLIAYLYMYIHTSFHLYSVFFPIKYIKNIKQHLFWKENCFPSYSKFPLSSISNQLYNIFQPSWGPKVSNETTTYIHVILDTVLLMYKTSGYECSNLQTLNINRDQM